MLTLALMANWIAHIVDVKGAFLYGKLEDREEIYMKIPEGWEHHYKHDGVLKLTNSFPVNCSERTHSLSLEST